MYWTDPNDYQRFLIPVATCTLWFWKRQLHLCSFQQLQDNLETNHDRDYHKFFRALLRPNQDREQINGKWPYEIETGTNK